MTEEAKWAVDILRNAAEYQWCSECVFEEACWDARFPECSYLRIASLIESMSAELEQVKQERDEAWKVVESVSRQNEIMAGALERVKRELEVQHD